MGFEDKVEQSRPRPYRQADVRLGNTCSRVARGSEVCAGKPSCASPAIIWAIRRMSVWLALPALSRANRRRFRSTSCHDRRISHEVAPLAAHVASRLARRCWSAARLPTRTDVCAFTKHKRRVIRFRWQARIERLDGLDINKRARADLASNYSVKLRWMLRQRPVHLIPITANQTPASPAFPLNLLPCRKV